MHTPKTVGQTNTPALRDHYVTVREAASIIGVSERTIYSYLEMGKLAGERIGQTIVLRKELVRRYRRPGVGRPRTRTPIWRLPVVTNLPYLLHITVRLRGETGQDERLAQRLAQIRTAQHHMIPGTVARYLARSTNHAETIQIVLVWRSQTLPPEAERAAALQALRADLDDLLDWESACSLEGPALLNT